MLTDDRDLAVTRMLLEFAASLQLSVTAEGVELPEQLQTLRDIAAGRPGFAQGYLISRPVPPDELSLPWPCGTIGPLLDDSARVPNGPLTDRP
jgi:EAL domain-containing protein (putative c-di-GMP-specific phosphodiesterase class I)